MDSDQQPPDASQDDTSGEEPALIASEDRRLAALAHVSVMGGLVVPGIGAFLVPLLIRLTEGRESLAVDREATEATNLGITLAVVQVAFNEVFSAKVIARRC